MNQRGTRGRTRKPRVIETRATISGPVLECCAAFGLAVRRSSRRGPDRALAATAARAARAIDLGLRPGQVALVTGPSGSGKSLVLRSLRERLRQRRVRVIVVAPGVASGRGHAARSVLDEFPGPTRRRLSWLAGAGLAEPALMPRRASELSDGQRSRLALARAMARAERARGARPLVLCDEFTSLLDRVTAAGVASALGRWARATGVRAVVATAHADLARALCPEWTITIGLDGHVEFTRPQGRRGGRGEGGQRTSHGGQSP